MIVDIASLMKNYLVKVEKGKQIKYLDLSQKIYQYVECGFGDHCSNRRDHFLLTD